MNLAKELEARGLIEHSSATPDTIFAEKRTVYLGVDPSADSMHAGNLLVVLTMKRLSDVGHKIILLVGGGTGMIGDPKEKGERPLIDTRTVAKNAQKLKAQMQRIVGTKIRVVNNADWLLKVRLVDFLRDIGKHFTVNELVKRDIIRRRLETPDESISYTEFAYSLLQGYDYLVLNKKYGCDLQIGASDQWTNILSGVELIRRKAGKEAYALTTPLVTDKNGKKFGKSEGNAVWLDAKKTTPSDFYQFWLNQPDEKVGEYLKMFTFLSLEEIAALMELHTRNPSARQAQKMLAREVTALVHGTAASEQIARTAETLYSKGSVANIALSGASTITYVAKERDTVSHLVAEGFGVSRSEARRLIQARGIRLNGETVETDRALTTTDFTEGKALLEKGKKRIVVTK